MTSEDAEYIGFNIDADEKQDWKDWVDEQRDYDTLTGLIKRAVRNQIAYDQGDGPWSTSDAPDSSENVQAEVDLQPVLDAIEQFSHEFREFRDDWEDHTQTATVTDDPTSDDFLKLMTEVRSLLPVTTSEDDYIETISGYTAEPDTAEEYAQLYGRVDDIRSALLENDTNVPKSDVRDVLDLLAQREEDVHQIINRGNRHYVIFNAN